MLGFKNKKLVGLDIGSSAIKLVQLKRSMHSWAVTAVGYTSVSPKKNFNDAGKEYLPLAVTKCVKQSRTKAERVVCGINGSDVLIRSFEFPILEPDELEGAVLMEARQVCPFESSDIAFDYEWAPNGDNKIQGFMVAATKSLINQTIKIVEKAGLTCVLADVKGLALLNCYNELHNFKNIAILNIGHENSTLAVENPRGLPFVRDIPYGGKSILNALVLDKKDYTSEQKKKPLNPEQEHQRYLDCLGKAMSKLTADINRTIQYTKTLNPPINISEILVCGDYALANGIIDILKDHLNMKVTLWNPFEHMDMRLGWGRKSSRTKRMLLKNGPVLAAAAGLAMRSI